MKVKTGTTLTLPLKVVIQITFCIADWTTVCDLLDALRPAIDLGPLEHLWQLRQLKWSKGGIWPRLFVPQWASNDHVRGIAKYFAAVCVDEDSDLNWFRQYVDPLASIDWNGNPWANDLKFLEQWKPFRITMATLSAFSNDQIAQGLSNLDHLVVLEHYECTPAVTAAILKFAASSVSLRELSLVSTGCDFFNPSTITTAIAKDFLHWVASRSIRRLILMEFQWEDVSLRNVIMETALGTKDLEILRISQCDPPGVKMAWDFYRSTSRLSFSYSRTLANQPLNCEDLHGQFYLFGPSLPSKIKVFAVTGLRPVGAGAVWVDIARLFHSSQVERLEITNSQLSAADEVEIANAICDHAMIQHVALHSFYWSVEGALAILKAAPSSLRSISLAFYEYESHPVYSREERSILKALALERSISMLC
ncbi:hypothetical protein AeRB84_006297 [Aphanomyces euteiches]|nr:hypothetical protein AeRB84_007457 [Aphanomyces euteiches]KAH9150986.1 hypothetical protein AeRB84_006297 [Aphanomyces euteiches]